MFFDRSLKPGKTKNGQPRGDLCSGFKFIYDKGLKGWAPGGVFTARGLEKTQKTKKLRKRSQVLICLRKLIVQSGYELGRAPHKPLASRPPPSWTPR